MATIREMETRDATAVADLHFRCINKGFLVTLGRRFLRQLYLGIAADPECRIWVAELNGQIQGFCAYAKDVAGLYKRVLKARFLRLGFASLPYSLNPWTVKEALDSLRYPAKQGAKKLPPAEILSIAVDASTRGSGVGKKLLEKAVERAALDGQAEIKLMAGAILEAANKFYPACGFTLIDTITQHGETMNVYVRKTS